MFRECGELLYGKGFRLKAEGGCFQEICMANNSPGVKHGA